MPYRAPVEDIRFILDHVVGFAGVAATPRFAEATPDMVDAILTEAGAHCDDVLAPLNRAGDLHPARLENGVVRRLARLCRGLPRAWPRAAGSAWRRTRSMAAWGCR